MFQDSTRYLTIKGASSFVLRKGFIMLWWTLMDMEGFINIQQFIVMDLIEL